MMNTKKRSTKEPVRLGFTVPAHVPGSARSLAEELSHRLAAQTGGLTVNAGEAIGAALRYTLERLREGEITETDVLGLS